MANGSVGKLREAEARILALQIAASFPSHQATTTQIKEALPEYRELSDADLVRSTTRPNEHKWEQIIGNVVSHKKSATSIFNRGYAIRTNNGIRVTEEGLAYLKAQGL